MPEDITNKVFRFYTRMHLSELTGIMAADLKELLMLIKSVNGSCIYHHTHRFLQQHEYLNPEPANDFAYWVSQALGEERLAEDLASIDTVRFTSIKALREALAEVISSHLENTRPANLRQANPGSEFCFIKSVSFVFPTYHSASGIAEFEECMRKITADSIYFHMYESRLRLNREENDFSYWLRNSLGRKKSADAINRLDPYTHTVEELRLSIIDSLKIGETA